MIINKIFFGNNNIFGPHNNKEFNFVCNNQKTPPVFIIFIGKNGSGKSSLLNAIKFCQWVQYNRTRMKPPIKYLIGKQKNEKICENNIRLFYQKKDKNFAMICENVKFNDFKQYVCERVKIILEEYQYINNHHLPLLFNNEYNFAPQLSTIKDNIKIFLLCYWNTMKNFESITQQLKNKNESLIIDEINKIIEKKDLFMILNNTLKKFLDIEVPKEQNFLSCNFFEKTTFQICKNNRKIDFDLLSSGEQHIFLILLLLTYETNEYLFTFDEPENSLYPYQQTVIVNYFISRSKQLISENKTLQFFISTHSPFIVKNFLNRNDTVIINVETGENILKSEKKKLLLNKNNNVSYDEISYLYYDIPTSNYYISLYEAMHWKFDECFEKNLKSKRKKEEDLCDFLSKINLESLKNKIYKVGCILSSDKLKKMKSEKITKITTDELGIMDNLSLLRDMLAHNDGSQNWNVKISEDKENSQIFEKDEESKNFYLLFKENFEKLLKEQIETIRTILINWEKIMKNFIESNKTL